MKFWICFLIFFLFSFFGGKGEIGDLMGEVDI